MPRPTPPRPTLRLLHTSDIHLTDHPASAEGLVAAVDVALAHRVDVVLIAGDLFDHPRVGEPATHAALQQLARLTQPTVVIPGNHDQLDEQSPYHRVDLRQAGPHVVFAGEPEGRHVVFDELALDVWARGIADHTPRHRPLAGYDQPTAGYWNVVVTHGHFVPDGEASDRSSRITRSELAALGCDYVALGHWHHFVDVSVDGVAAFYSGSPSEPPDRNPTVSVVTLEEPSGARVERVGIAPRTLRRSG
ncbi:MAG TPA: metallophosphoesterase [Acidimicrobiales bacterium]